MKHWLLCFLTGFTVFSQLPLADLGFGIHGGSIAMDGVRRTQLNYGAQIYAGIWKLRFEPSFEASKYKPSETSARCNLKTLSFDFKYEIADRLITKIFVGGGYMYTITDVTNPGFQTNTKVISPKCNGFNILGSGEADLLFLKFNATAKFIHTQVPDFDRDIPSLTKTSFKRKAINMYSISIGVNYNIL